MVQCFYFMYNIYSIEIFPVLLFTILIYQVRRFI